jgi:predicted ATPase
VLLKGLAPLDLRLHNQARRFMSFIDIMYDEGCLLVLGATCPATVQKFLKSVPQPNWYVKLG